MTPQPDFLRPVRGPHPLAWLACATALAVLGVAALEAWDAWQQSQAPVAAQVATPPPAPSRAETDTQRSLQQALARLQRRWPQHFAALDAVDVPGITWLALDIGDSDQLRLQGQASGSAAAFAAADQLRRQPLWRAALLGRMDTPAPGAALRFEISAEAAR